MATLERAIEIAAQAHSGDTDRQGAPYILHAVRVMMGTRHPDARIVGILHDVVEDTKWTFDDIRNEGFNEEILTALRLVTHEKTESYAEYVIRCKPNPLAKEVKLSDLRDNSTLDRALVRKNLMEKDTKRIMRYHLSYQYLTDQIDEATYRELMKPVE